MLTRKYYKMIAKVIKDNSQTLVDEKSYSTQEGDTLTDWIHKDDLIKDLSIEFKKDNSLFCWDKFEDACNK
jgi:hypothetical protein